MKHIISVLFLFALFSGCRPGKLPSTVIPLELVDYYGFREGSYWVYYNVNTGFEDSFYTTGFVVQNQNSYGNQDYQSFFWSMTKISPTRDTTEGFSLKLDSPANPSPFQSSFSYSKDASIMAVCCTNIKNLLYWPLKESLEKSTENVLITFLDTTIYGQHLHNITKAVKTNSSGQIIAKILFSDKVGIIYVYIDNLAQSSDCTNVELNLLSFNAIK